jgi:putative transposase
MVLPSNHLHVILTQPEGDMRSSGCWGWIKMEFTKAYLAAGGNEGFPFKARLSRSWLALSNEVHRANG